MSAPTSRHAKAWAVTIGAMATTVALAAVAMGAINDRDADGSGTTPASREGAAMISTPSAEQMSAFALLRRDQRPGDDPGSTQEGPFGARLSLARQVDSAAGAVWVVPANDHMCLRTQSNVSTMWTCTTTAEAIAGRLVLSVRTPDAKTALAIYALVPDGASAISTRAAGDQATRMTASDNVVAARSSDATMIGFTDAAGTRHSQPVP